MDSLDLFSHSHRREAPLAERMRPKRLEEFVGQAHVVGKGHLLDRLRGRKLPSLILWGPPGTGKTTLARLLAEQSKAFFVGMSAVQIGVKELREAVADAERRLGQAQQTVLFLDEIHRFNKAQQDALLPHVEVGTITLIGATTENPSFEVNAALLSRTKVVRLESLAPKDIRTLLDRALTEDRGLKSQGVTMEESVRDFVAEESGGDARRALQTLDVATELALGRADGVPPVIDLDTVREAMQQKTLIYDKAGDEHYNVISAFIKSMRGSDPDASIYWLARLVEAGEDPLFIMRRIVIFASEDVGNADPQALQVAIAAMQAVHFVGLPEGKLHMSQAVLYLANAKKSNSALTSYSAARQAVEDTGTLPVPLHLRNAPTGLMKKMGYGAGYKYPHDDKGPQSYLPDQLKGRRFYVRIEPKLKDDEKK